MLGLGCRTVGRAMTHSRPALDRRRSRTPHGPVSRMFRPVVWAVGSRRACRRRTSRGTPRVGLAPLFVASEFMVPAGGLSTAGALRACAIERPLVAPRPWISWSPSSRRSRRRDTRSSSTLRCLGPRPVAYSPLVLGGALIVARPALTHRSDRSRTSVASGVGWWGR